MSKYQCAVDFDAITALDVHTHVEIDSSGHRSLDDELMAASEKYFKSGAERTPSLDAIAQHYRERGMAAVVFTVDCETATGHPPNSVVEIAEGAARNNDVLIPFGSVDPWRGAAAVRRVHQLVEQHGVRGFKFHPSLQGFEPNDRRFYPLYEAIAEHGVPALFHTGQTGVGAGMRGGMGIRLEYSNPMHLEQVGIDFPDMPIVMAHPSFPWQDEALAVATHKPTCYIDLSGWSPKYFPQNLIQYSNSLLKHRVLFGSDFPVITPDRWIADFEKLPIKPEVRPLIMKQNAAKLLGLSS